MKTVLQAIETGSESSLLRCSSCKLRSDVVLLLAECSFLPDS